MERSLRLDQHRFDTTTGLNFGLRVPGLCALEISLLDEAGVAGEQDLDPHVLVQVSRLRKRYFEILVVAVKGRCLWAECVTAFILSY
jgi:hypothetical protein